MRPIKSLVAATRPNAELVGMGSELGTLEEEKLSDLLILEQFVKPHDD